MWQKSKNLYHLSNAVTAHALAGFPARKGITFIGVTGTDGKTTTSNMIYHILHAAGFSVALISTVGAIINDEVIDTGFHVTTPDSQKIAQYIRRAKNAGCAYIVLETTSHALDQHRVFGIPFHIGVLTNITHEHLDYHKTYEKYVEAKLKLLKNSQIAIINRDDQSFESLKLKFKSEKFEFGGRNEKIVTYGLTQLAHVNPHMFPFKNSLLGDFNKYNCLAAIAVCLELDVDQKIIRAGLEDFIAPEGRTEIVYDKDFIVMIDFAHTPNSIEQVLYSIKKSMQNRGRIIHVFGSAGLRDRTKRPLMGSASDKYADVIILTAEDPRTEDVHGIIAQIESGIKNYELRKNKMTLFEIANRQEAIYKAIAIAKKHDTLVITGKGHEKSMNFGKGEVPWSDHEVVREAIRILTD